MTYSGLKATFDSAAQQYAAVRPGYPAELVEAIVQYANRAEGNGRLLEIGCGTGLATDPFAARGYEILCLEPGANLAAVARERFQAFPKVSVETVTFEDWSLEEAAFDLVFSAQAFHWVAPEVGYPKAALALKPTGSLALYWNLVPDNPDLDPTDLVELSEAIQSQYTQHAPEMAHTRRGTTLEEQVATMERQLRSYSDLFRDIQTLRFPWIERYDAARYIALLSTYSGHIALPEEQRQGLLNGIAQAIEANGGILVKPYVSVLLLTHRAP